MAATTGQLGLVTPTQGTLSGTWGDTVNNGITEYVNIAIAGTTTFSGDGAVTLANTTGSAAATNIGSTTAQYMVVQITGTLTGTKTITAPSYSKIYLVDNTTATYGVTFKASGQTGVTIAAGEKAFVYFNGTDYVKAATSTALTSAVSTISFGSTGLTPSTATSGAVSVAGTLALTNGGTGKTTAPAAMANLMGYTSTATAAGTTTLTNTSSYYQQFTGTTTQTVQLPVTSTLQTGWTFHIVNNSTGNLSVVSSGSNAVITVVPGTTAMCTCIGTSLTTAADWESGITDFSTITGTGDAVLGTSPTITTAALTNPTVTNYVETPYSANSSTAITLALTNGTVQIITLTGNATITMPTAVSGKSFIMFLKQDATGSRTVTWSTVAWPGGTAPTITSTASKQDIYSFFSDGSKWYGVTVGQNYTP